MDDALETREESHENQEDGWKRRMLFLKAERMRVDHVKCLRTGDWDSEGQISRMRREPNTLFVRDEIR